MKNVIDFQAAKQAQLDKQSREIFGLSLDEAANAILEGFVTTMTESILTDKKAALEAELARVEAENQAAIKQREQLKIDTQDRVAKAAQTIKNLYPNKYTEVRGVPMKEVAKMVRKDIKAAIARGYLPKCKFSVKSTYNTISIEMKATEAGLEFKNPEMVAYYETPVNERLGSQPPRFTATASIWYDTMKAILDQYNFNDSDYYSDYHSVNFYGTVGIY